MMLDSRVAVIRVAAVSEGPLGDITDRVDKDGIIMLASLSVNRVMKIAARFTRGKKFSCDF